MHEEAMERLHTMGRELEAAKAEMVKAQTAQEFTNQCIQMGYIKSNEDGDLSIVNSQAMDNFQ